VWQLNPDDVATVSGTVAIKLPPEVLGVSLSTINK